MHWLKIGFGLMSARLAKPRWVKGQRQFVLEGGSRTGFTCDKLCFQGWGAPPDTQIRCGRVSVEESVKTPQIAAPHSQDMAERGQEESESENAYPPKKFGPFAAVVCSFARSADSHLRWASERGKTSPLNQRAAASLRLPNAVMTSHDIVEAGENRPSPPCGLSHSVRVSFFQAVSRVVRTRLQARPIIGRSY
jgi:hypothetical protein